MLLLVAVAAVLLANAECFTPRDANNYIDYVLTSNFASEVQYSRLDPIKLPDIKIDLISKRVWDNKATLTKGELHNLSKVKRVRDCSVPHWSSANITFICTLGFKELIVNYTANVSYDNMQLIFYPVTSITEGLVTIQITSSKYENIPSLRLLIVNSVGKMYVTSRMISVGDVSQIVGPQIRDAIVEASTTNLHKILTGRFKEALGYSIYKTPVPFV
ncbi:uncharacterized protein LOC129960655 [Argiope bruennichi]|uniref:uncharacterized protein LOC129960655 n=1 Tax=Argiope bruennichi TaxID=94029 RepID=UPI002493E67C|nr:uncharacterized protein LOC129960655 [Argiope bruennichi]